MKEKFYKYLGSENDLSGYQRSYKLVFYKYLFEMMDDQGYAPAYEVTTSFRDFYIERIKQGKLPDANVDSRIQNAQYSSIREIYALINENPFYAISSQGFLSKEIRTDSQGNRKEYFRLAPELVTELTSIDIEHIKAIVDKKLKLYFSRIDTVTLIDLRSLFINVMNSYLSAKRQPFTNNPLADLIRNSFRDEIYKTGFIAPEKYVVNGSPGQGNWAAVPWVGIFNKSITTTATRGVYIVYLFSSNCDSVYLTLNQGCTELKNVLGKSGAVKAMKEVSEEIISKIDSRGFSVGDNIDLKDSHELPYLYERGTIFYKEYKKDQLPSNEVLISDLKKMVDIYEEYIDRILMQDTKVNNNTIGSDNNMSIKDIVEYIYINIFKSLDKAASSFATTKQYYGIAPNDNINPMYLIQVQSDAISFNPAFKMKYQDSNDPFSAFKNVWVLAAGKKTFISNDYVKIELKNSDVSVTAPWSRDSEDKVDKNGNVRTIPTAKSGNTIKTSADGATLQVDVYYHIQDPNFVDPSQRTTLQAKNDAKAKQFDDMVNSIASAFENNGVSFYSNLFQSTTAETVHKVSAPSYFKDYSEKSILKFAQPITTSVKSQTKAYYIDVNGVADYTTSARKININGNSVPVTEKWADISAVRSEEVMKGLLEQNAGYTKKWYSEDYEGIIVVHKTYLIAINNLESTYAQIHPQTSDSLTKRNELAQDLKFAQGSETLIEDHFGIGVEYRLPSLTINNETFSNIVIPSKPYLFDIRGAVYDTK